MKSCAWGGLKGQLLHTARGNAPGNGSALIKVSRSVRAASFMRGNAPCAVGVTRFRRVAFLRRRHKNAECNVRCIRFPRALPWAMGGIWAYSPPQLCLAFSLRQVVTSVFNRLFHYYYQFATVALKIWSARSFTISVTSSSCTLVSCCVELYCVVAWNCRSQCSLVLLLS